MIRQTLVYSETCVRLIAYYSSVQQYSHVLYPMFLLPSFLFLWILLLFFILFVPSVGLRKLQHFESLVCLRIWATAAEDIPLLATCLHILV